MALIVSKPKDVREVRGEQQGVLDALFIVDGTNKEGSAKAEEEG